VKELQSTRTYLEQGDVAAIESSASNLRDRLLIRVLSHLGCRITESLNIAIDDIDFVTSTVRILHLKIRLELFCPKCTARVAVGHTYCPKCGERVQEAVAKELEHRRQRLIPIDSKTLAMMKEYIDSGGPVIRNGRRLLFGINRHRAWQVVKKCADAAGLPSLTNAETGRKHHVSPHRLRDAFAVHAVKTNDSGDGLRMLQIYLGHQSISTTMGYRKVSSQEQNIWYSRLWETEENDNPKTKT
jgi:integrase/recombinase XerD